MVLCIKRFDELTTRELHDILKLRADVFVVEQKCSYPDVDGLDIEAVHVYFRDGNSIAAYLRVLNKNDEPGVAKIGRVIAVKRGCGIGRAIMQAGMRAATDTLAAKEIYLEAQEQARGFYEKLGFSSCSDVFDEAGIPHVAMRKPL